MHTLITSTHNPKIKSLLALEKARERKRQCLFVIEGRKEIERALTAGYTIGNLFFCPDFIGVGELRSFPIDEKQHIPVSREVFGHIAMREGSGGVVAVAEQKVHPLKNLVLDSNPLILVLESVEKPGNLGAMLRTADAAGVTAVICCDTQTDLYNPNVVRASLGGLFTRQIALARGNETRDWLSAHGIRMYCTHLAASHPYHMADYKVPCAIVMGTESTGLSDEWVRHAHQNIIIPMKGVVDSMNVSTAAAVVIFEAWRQRGFT